VLHPPSADSRARRPCHCFTGYKPVPLGLTGWKPVLLDSRARRPCHSGEWVAVVLTALAIDEFEGAGFGFEEFDELCCGQVEEFGGGFDITIKGGCEVEYFSEYGWVLLVVWIEG